MATILEMAARSFRDTGGNMWAPQCVRDMAKDSSQENFPTGLAGSDDTMFSGQEKEVKPSLLRLLVERVKSYMKSLELKDSDGGGGSQGLGV